MTEYHDIDLKKFVDLATESSGELGYLGDDQLIDYETGRRYTFKDETAKFLASARSIVLELARRIADLEAQAIKDARTIEGLSAQIVHAQMELAAALGHEEADYHANLGDLADEAEQLRQQVELGAVWDVDSEQGDA